MSLPNPQDLISLMYGHIIKEIDNETCLIGIPTGGEIILEELKKKLGNNINSGLIDTSYYREIFFGLPKSNSSFIAALMVLPV